jgi:hypothetical protein
MMEKEHYKEIRLDENGNEVILFESYREKIEPLIIVYADWLLRFFLLKDRITAIYECEKYYYSNDRKFNKSHGLVTFKTEDEFNDFVKKGEEINEIIQAQINSNAKLLRSLYYSVNNTFPNEN